MPADWRDAPRGDFAVIGDPVSHSLSPRMHAAAFKALGFSYSYHAFRVSPGEVAECLYHLASIGYRGVNATVPHKAETYAAADWRDSFTARCCAANTIDLWSLRATNTDGPGFLDTLPADLGRGSNVLLLGAGGSARAIALALALEGYNLRIYNRTHERASALIRELDIEAHVVDNPAIQDVQLIVNATSASLHSESLPLNFASAAEGALAYDLVYGETPFLQAAATAGLRTMDGKALLVAQGARALQYWLQIDAPRDVMLEAIR